MEALKRFSQNVIDTIRSDIEDADGNEVFWAGKINLEGIVVSVQAGARGNENSVVVNKNTAREGNVIIHNHPSGNLSPSEADQNIAYNASDTSLGFYIVDNEVSRVYVVVEPVKPKKIELLNEDETAFFLSNQGPFAKSYGNYEERPSQISLSKEIASSFNKEKIGVFEAGTGVGKSFAYLIPAMLWSVKNKECVVVSTGTINLQQQLFEKDIPFAQKLIGKKIKAVLLKGRQNYICLRRLSEAENDRSLFNEEIEIIDKISEWTKTSATGSKSDLTFLPSESVWSKVNSESDACLGGRCPFRENCFVMKVRNEAASANIIIVNHHLLFADIESRMSGAGYDNAAVLPPYRRIIFDEAHGIEDSATSFFSEIITRFKVMKQVNLLFRTFRSSNTGFLVQAAAFSSADDCMERALSLVNGIKDSLLELDQISILELDENFNARIYSGNSQKFSGTFNALSKLKSAISAFNNLVREVLEKIDDKDSEVPAVWEAKTVLRRLESLVALCGNFLLWEEKEDTVFWLQKVKIPPKVPGEDFVTFVQFIQTPLDIAPLMNSGVFEPMKPVVCTSATLRIDKNFGYWTRRVGISFVEPERVAQGSFDSPFLYKENVLFAVPNDAPFPDSPYFQTFVEDAIPKLILAAGGKTLVLFTSYDSLKFTFNASRNILSENGIEVFKQGDEDRFRLLEKFKKDTNSVLFATDSFWEGVDVPGSSLSQVIIVKLPFAVPNDPVFSARSEALEKKGGNPFMQLSLPQAVIKFRQGFGRLVRRADDKGIVVVLDRRIVEKKYGGIFTRSVPMTKRMYSPLDAILHAVKNFFN
ncbi:helicase C-terminal domain-containing protein [uncultured Treponema sp.]|uniref:helicase C-terminal domain-containing protein n=1 Tax=uncultured Treponema sp. TaxID=162155 RepID=UPI0025DFF510|nr:helicase C-terminal domain-containing protein [uncultured Treponema sp.]